MSRNGSGVYNLPAGNPVVTGTTISSTWANNTLTDIATAITGSVAADGQTPITGNLAMGGNKLTGLGTGTAAGDSVEYAQFTTPTFTGDVTCESTGFILVPKGTTAERPVTPVEGLETRTFFFFISTPATAATATSATAATTETETDDDIILSSSSSIL